MKTKALCMMLAGPLAAAGCAAPQAVPAGAGEPVAIARHYRPGHTWRYRMLTTYIENGQKKRVTESVTTHQAVAGDPPGEVVQLERVIRDLGDVQQVFDSSRAELPAWWLSLAAGGRVALPPLAGLPPSMVGAIADLQTFLVAISPNVGADRLRRVGDAHVLERPTTGDWSGSAGVPVGLDCIQPRVELIAVDDRTVRLRTTFEPPAESCAALAGRPAWQRVPVQPDAGPNNFLQVLAVDGRYVFMWGRERFTVEAEVRRSDGLLLAGRMDNRLQLRMRVLCDRDGANCRADEVPLRIRRQLRLELLQSDGPDRAERD